ncbi:MAG: purine-nucleoside phosphorylase [Bacteroidetes bacterium CG18_big_fil_WC_8_21_14_2_50_41_14]|nr:MAG: purine-nucleoside phosphorylase [Bacteroidetes bacterium CG18_big_fil_WC_8_21_14_2_50_41_14]PJB56740.1 MAG: purine-nucleoside phosphorylase [Bacteroidetes bacterium CG_4_9_14_3_um_filter_41_19]
MMQKINEAVAYLQKQGVGNPKIGIVLGTGLGGMVKNVVISHDIHYRDIPHFPESTVESHSGKLIFGSMNGKQVVVMNGRFHFYEGYSFDQITFGIRVMKLLGVDTLLVSNAAGAIDTTFKPASLMLIDDHINMLPGNPLVGKNLDELGTRFPDMSAPYDAGLMAKMEQIASEESIELNKGVYVAWIGPSLETRAEYRFIKTMGADAVGMSTVPEVIVARHMDMRVLAISVITDLCDPDNLKPGNINDILANAARAEKDLVKLFTKLVLSL